MQENHYRDAIRLDPDLLGAHNNLATLLLTSGREKEGLHHLQEVLRIDPKSAEAAYNIGNALSDIGRMRESIEYFKMAIRVSPEKADYHNNLGYALVQTGSPEQAIRHFEKAKLFGATDPMVDRNIVNAHRLQKDFARRKAKLDERLQNNPGDPVLTADKGDIYRDINNLDQAIVYYRKSLESAPDYTRAMAALAVACAQTNDLDCAENNFLKVIDTHPHSDKTSYNLSCVYSRKGEIQKSLEWLKKAISLGYDNWALIETDKDLINLRASNTYKEYIQTRR